MATILWCPKCEDSTFHNGIECISCNVNVYEKEKTETLLSKSQLTVNERLIMIEPILFDLQHKPKHNHHHYSPIIFR